MKCYFSFKLEWAWSQDLGPGRRSAQICPCLSVLQFSLRLGLLWVRFPPFTPLPPQTLGDPTTLSVPLMVHTSHGKSYKFYHWNNCKKFNKTPKNMLLEPTRTKIFRKSDLLEINECMYFIQSLRSFLLNFIFFLSIYNHKFSERNIWIIFCIISGLGTHFRAKILLFCWSVQKSSEFRFVCWANLINLFCVPKRKSSKLTKAKVNWISWEQFSSQTDSFKIYIEMGKIIKTKIAKIYIS